MSDAALLSPDKEATHPGASDRACDGMQLSGEPSEYASASGDNAVSRDEDDVEECDEDSSSDAENDGKTEKEMEEGDEGDEVSVVAYFEKLKEEEAERRRIEREQQRKIPILVAVRSRMPLI